MISLGRIVTCAALLSSCHPAGKMASGSLPQRGYLWQRDWTPAVVDSLGEVARRMDGVIVLGAETVWHGKEPEVIRATIDWKKLAAANVPCALALRVAPGPVSASFDTIASVAQSLLSDARGHGIVLSELQLDYDCPQKELASYKNLVTRLRALVRPIRLVITTLPSWLDEPEFPKLVGEADGYVLQVHSVPITAPNGRAELFDAGLAETWVAKAARIGLPFSVALPTYRCVAGYDAKGKLAGVLMDSVQPSWPAGTSMLELGPDADAIAETVKKWREARPALLRELLWYRVPIASDTRNWRWETLSAVMAGRKPVHRLEIIQAGVNPIDLALLNSGEVEEHFASAITAAWSEGDLVSSDALAGWDVRPKKNQATFAPAQNSSVRLAPGERRNIGWLRFARPTNLQCGIGKHDAITR